MRVNLEFGNRDALLLFLGAAVADEKRGLGGWVLGDLTLEGDRRWVLGFRFLVDGRTFTLQLEPRTAEGKAFIQTRRFLLGYLPGQEAGPHEQLLLKNLGKVLLQREGQLDDLHLPETAPPATAPDQHALATGTAAEEGEARLVPLEEHLARSGPLPPPKVSEWPTLLEGWENTGTRFEGTHRVVFSLRHEDSDTTLDLLFSPRDEAKTCLVRNRLANIEYRTIRSNLTSRDQREVAFALIASLEERFPEFYRLFPHLIFNADRLPTDTEEHERLRGEHLPALARRMTFSAEGIAEFLAPEIRLGAEIVGDWILEDISYGNTARRNERVETYHLIFHSKALGEHLALVLMANDASRSAFARTEHFAVNLLTGFKMGGRDLSAQGLAVASTFVAILALKDIPSLVVDEPEVESLKVFYREEHPEQTRGDAMFNLAINPDCGQACVFCSIHDVLPPQDGGQETLNKAKAELLEARADGVRGVRINGIDPLAFSRIFELLEVVGSLDFAPVEVFSPGRQFADAEFLERFLGLMPESFLINIPLYGVEASYHDAVTGRPGSFEAVWHGMQALLRRCGPKHLRVLSVPVRQNADHFPAIVRWCEEQGIPFSGHQPYPNTGSHQDRYLESVLPLTEVVERVGAAGPVDSISDIPPCIPFHLTRTTGRPYFAYWGYGPDVSLAGASYTEAGDEIYHAPDEPDIFTVATVPCPHQDVCLLARFCPRGLYRLYAEKFGLEELRPVHLIEFATTKLPEAPKVHRPDVHPTSSLLE